MKILILGGYGVFGGRLIELLCDSPDLNILIGGRSLAKAQAFCKRIECAAELLPLAVDRDHIDASLQEHNPDILVDSSGPFQEYGTDPYKVVEHCIRRGVNYIDFADGSDFVFGIDQFDAAAKVAGVFVLSGVSSFPVLTAAVVREFAKEIDIRTVTGGIAPSPYAGIGMNVMRAVLGYAGSPVSLMRAGMPSVVPGLTESLRYTISPPGYLPLRNLHFSLVDVPDLQVIPRAFTEITDIWMGAGPVPEILHRALNMLAKLRARLGLPSLTPLAPYCYWLLNHMRFGEDRGGMFVEVSGEGGEQKVTRSWHLLAEGDDGPYIPAMAIEIIVRKLLEDHRPEAGARAATNEINLDDYERVFAKRRIVCGYRSRTGDYKSAFEYVLASCMPQLPRSIAEFHCCADGSEWTGQANVRPASNPLARLVALAFGFPTVGGPTPVRVTVDREADQEQWHRQFGNSSFHSTLSLGHGLDEFLICERFGFITVSMAIVWNEEKLHFIPRRWRLGPLPLPRFLLPKGNSYESDNDGQFAFKVELAAPLLGRIVAYSGTLTLSHSGDT